MGKTLNSEIEDIKDVWLDGQKYCRVFYVNNNYFDDVPVSVSSDSDRDGFYLWKEATGNYEKEDDKFK